MDLNQFQLKAVQAYPSALTYNITYNVFGILIRVKVQYLTISFRDTLLS